MSGLWVALLAIGFAALQLSIAAGVGLYLSNAVDEIPGLAENVLDIAADSLTEAGFALPEEDLDDPLLEHRVVVITEGMNERTARGVVRKLLYLAADDPVAPIDLYISTQGGWFDSAFAIIDTMEMIPAPVNTIAVGGCYSAGTLVLMSGTGTRSATPNALISLHANFFDEETPDSIGTLERGRVEKRLREHARLPADWLPFEDDATYYMTAERALELAIIDRILPASPHRPSTSADGDG
jgi:ATP-dependent Clp protease protease subunit